MGLHELRFMEMDFLDNSNTIICAGYRLIPVTDANAAIYKININSSVETHLFHGGDRDDYFYDIQTLKDKSGFVCLGHTRSFGTGTPSSFYGNFFLARYDNNLLHKWTKTYGGDRNDDASTVIETSDGGFLLSGRTRSFGFIESAAYLIKTDQNGDTIWTRTYHNNNGKGWQNAYDVIETSDTSGFIWVGNAHPDRLWISKIDYFGDTLWTKTLDIGTNEYARKILQTNDGGYIIAGGVKIGPSASPIHPFLLKLSAETSDSLNTCVSGVELNNNEKTFSDNYRFFPNPHDQELNFSIVSNGNENLRITIYNVLGSFELQYKSFLRRKGMHKLKIDTRHLDAGIYYCRIQLGQKFYADQIIKH